MYQIVLAVAIAAVSADEEKKTEKRGLSTLGYGYDGLAGYGGLGGLSTGYGGYSGYGKNTFCFNEWLEVPMTGICAIDNILILLVKTA